MQQVLRIPFNKWQLVFGVTCYVVFYSHLAMNYAEEVFHILPAKSGTVDPIVRTAVAVFAISYLPNVLRHSRMLFSSGPAVVVGEDGIQAFPWNRNTPLKWSQVKDVKLTDWSLPFRKGRAYRYLTIKGQDGQKLKVESHIIRRKDWLVAYEAILERAPSEATKSLVLTEKEASETNREEVSSS